MCVALSAGHRDIDPPLVRQLQNSGAKTTVIDDPHVQRLPHSLRQRERIALDHKVDVFVLLDPQQRVTDRAADQADRHVHQRQRPHKRRMRLHRSRDPRRIRHVAYDPLSEKLRAATPVAIPELLELFARFEGLPLTGLQEAFAACEARFRVWVEAPENVGKPINQSPDYLERIALDSLLERRTWAE